MGSACAWNPSRASAAASRASSMAHHLPSTRRQSCLVLCALMATTVHTNLVAHSTVAPTSPSPSAAHARSYCTSPSPAEECALHFAVDLQTLPEVSPHATLAACAPTRRFVIGASTKLSLANLAALPRYQTFRDSCAVAPYLAYIFHLSCKLTSAWRSLPSIVSRPASNIADP